VKTDHFADLEDHVTGANDKAERARREKQMHEEMMDLTKAVDMPNAKKRTAKRKDEAGLVAAEEQAHELELLMKLQEAERKQERTQERSTKQEQRQRAKQLQEEEQEAHLRADDEFFELEHAGAERRRKRDDNVSDRKEERRKARVKQKEEKASAGKSDVVDDDADMDAILGMDL
jgi:hypothetical protein